MDRLGSDQCLQLVGGGRVAPSSDDESAERDAVALVAEAPTSRASVDIAAGFIPGAERSRSRRWPSPPSVDRPSQAYSQSWIVPAPLVARWVSQPASHELGRGLPAVPLRRRWAP